MATPIKSVAPILSSPKFLSPITSAFFSPLKSKNSVYSEPLCRTKLPVKNTNFRINRVSKKLFESNDHKSLKYRHNIKIFVEDTEKNEITNINSQVNESSSYLINTPNKSQLLKYGLSKLNENFFGIGKGAFGTVIKGNYEGNLVAVKIVKFNNKSEIFREANALNLKHKNIVEILDFIIDEKEKRGLIFMEYFTNSRNFQSVLDDYTFELSRIRIIRFCQDIARGIDFCHRNSILHLDIKAKNVLLCGDVCKICDFGNSLKVTAGQIAEDYQYKGTIAYTAPEILLGKIPTEKSDVYSLGILFWQIDTRKTPYEGLENEVVAYKVVKCDMRPNLENFEYLPNEFQKLYIFCWQKNPEERPDTGFILEKLESL